MAHMLELDVNNFGYVTGGDEFFTVNTAFHRWLEPYPFIGQRLELTWTEGDVGFRPDVFHHNRLRDMVCNQRAMRLLSEVTHGDLHVVAHAHLDGEELTVLQATAVLDVVDAEKSLLIKDRYGSIAFPHIPTEAEPEITNRVFRVPEVGQSLNVFVGEHVRRVLQAGGIRGLLFTKAEVVELI